VPILPDFECWPNKYVVVHFPENDPANDSRTLAKVGIVAVTRQACGMSVLLAGHEGDFCLHTLGSTSNPPCRGGPSHYNFASRLYCVHVVPDQPLSCTPIEAMLGRAGLRLNHLILLPIDSPNDFRKPLQVSNPQTRRELLSHSMLKSYQTQSAAQGSAQGSDLTVGLLVPHVSGNRPDSMQPPAPLRHG